MSETLASYMYKKTNLLMARRRQWINWEANRWELWGEAAIAWQIMSKESCNWCSCTNTCSKKLPFKYHLYGGNWLGQGPQIREAVVVRSPACFCELIGPTTWLVSCLQKREHTDWSVKMPKILSFQFIFFCSVLVLCCCVSCTSSSPVYRRRCRAHRRALISTDIFQPCFAYKCCIFPLSFSLSAAHTRVCTAWECVRGLPHPSLAAKLSCRCILLHCIITFLFIYHYIQLFKHFELSRRNKKKKKQPKNQQGTFNNWKSENARARVLCRPKKTAAWGTYWNLTVRCTSVCAHSGMPTPPVWSIPWDRLIYIWSIVILVRVGDCYFYGYAHLNAPVKPIQLRFVRVRNKNIVSH